MLLRNGQSLSSSPLRFMGGTVYSLNVANFMRASGMRALPLGPAGIDSSGNSISDTAARPNGYEPPASWSMAYKGGGLSSYNSVNGEGDLTGHLSMGVALEAALEGAGEISNAELALIVQLAAALTGSGTISSATLQAVASLSAALSGSGEISAAALSLIVSLEADLSGSGEIAGNLKGLAHLAADIVVTGSGLTESGIATAVWSALAASNNDPLTMGEKLNSAASAGDPWGTALPGAYSAGSAGHIVGNRLDSTISDIPADVVAALNAEEYDGVSFELVLQILLAMAQGRIVEDPADSGVFKFYAQDNTTLLYTLTKSGNERNRS